MTDWMPISTAPKDGTRILVSNGKYIEIAYWSDAKIWDSDADDDYFHWVTYEVDDWFYSEHLIDEYEPTFWMSLPNPPLKV